MGVAESILDVHEYDRSNLESRPLQFVHRRRKALWIFILLLSSGQFRDCVAHCDAIMWRIHNDATEVDVPRGNPHQPPQPLAALSAAIPYSLQTRFENRTMERFPPLNETLLSKSHDNSIAKLTAKLLSCRHKLRLKYL